MSPMRNGRLHLHREEAVLDRDGKRHCAHCGDFIDPKDWCAGCKGGDRPCGDPHKRLVKRADAAYCTRFCRSAYRSTFISGCLTPAERRGLR